jgi:hypothetical protein
MERENGISCVKYLVSTAVFLALAIVSQMLRTFFPYLDRVSIGGIALSIFIVGSLVNLFLIMAVWTSGFWSGAAIAVLSVVVAYLQGHIPQALPQLMAAVALGNLAIVSTVYFLREQNRALAVLAGAAIKFAILYAAVQWVVIPFWVNLEHLGSEPLAAKLTATLSRNFSWPQFVTSAIGGALAILVLPVFKHSGKGTPA